MTVLAAQFFVNMLIDRTVDQGGQSFINAGKIDLEDLDPGLVHAEFSALAHSAGQEELAIPDRGYHPGVLVV